MSDPTKLIDIINEQLPQTQCGLCSYPSCKPYAKAIVEKNEQINRCAPGGLATLYALADLLKQDATPLAQNLAIKPPAQAKIRENECIGCTKCIQACPVDAIVGSAKQMHTILSTECTGCELCIPPCPVDCIELITLPEPQYHPAKAKMRYEARLKRLAHPKPPRTSKAQSSIASSSTAPTPNKIQERLATIEAALARVKAKKMLKDKP